MVCTNNCEFFPCPLVTGMGQVLRAPGESVDGERVSLFSAVSKPIFATNTHFSAFLNFSRSPRFAILRTAQISKIQQILPPKVLIFE